MKLLSQSLLAFEKHWIVFYLVKVNSCLQDASCIAAQYMKKALCLQHIYDAHLTDM